ncbi:MAG: acyl-ACP--UDP-N-acetylglucosamine O-acyltransferase [Candidatus Omnitrophica bacterium]|nr:acyl-ACP--UDP-N-acetylglucosamine O-acyltransferase [Candidatus Omnitrophota bacterium]MCG2702839.1 acyl-ACP--UDP-N-acetylglucosamine O-acyltransferase [Candidatus Omnitrophota bacterium]
MSKNANIHPTACVHPKAQLEECVSVGPFSVVGEQVRIGAQTSLGNSCLIDGHTQIGKRCKIFTGAVIGSIPQDLKYKGEKAPVIIGDDNIIREYVTINSGTAEKGKTVIGNKNLLMAYCHVAHDCEIFDEVVIANVGTLAGHVSIEKRAVIGGLVAIHQFVRVGQFAIVGGCSKVTQDIPPYAMVDGHPARVYGINNVGLKRANIPAESIQYLKTAFKILFRIGLATTNALKRIKNEIPPDSHVEYLIKFIENSQRGVCTGRV